MIHCILGEVALYLAKTMVTRAFSPLEGCFLGFLPESERLLGVYHCVERIGACPFGAEEKLEYSFCESIMVPGRKCSSCTECGRAKRDTM